jgi:ubiquinone/menaquinone biosynthesis C-methylase UbiE
LSKNSASGELSRQIYEQLGVTGLESRTSIEWDRLTVERVERLLARSPTNMLLDAGCGYGRIAVPLAQAGYQIVGVDVSPLMLEEAKRRAIEAGVSIELRLGDLCQLPFEDESFDVVLCMWLTFNELLHEEDQLAALAEMSRVVRSGGWCLIDGPPYMEDSSEVDEVDMSQYLDSGPRAAFTQVPLEECAAGRRFQQLMELANIQRYALYVDDCPGRLRYFLQFWPVSFVIR